MTTYARSMDFLFNQLRSTSAGSLASGKLYFYDAGTTTAKAIYLDRAMASPAANPYTLSSDGTAKLFGNGLYRVIIKTSAGTTIYDYDNVLIQDFSTTITSLTTAEYFSGDYATLAAAVTAISTTPATLVVNTTLPSGASPVTVPSTLAIEVRKGGSITLNANVTFNGAFIAGVYQVFSGGSVASFGNVLRVVPEWWAPNTTPGTTDMTAAIQAALNTGKHTVLSATTYGTTGVNPIDNSVLTGCGHSSILKNLSTGNVISASSKSGIVLKDFAILGSNSGAGDSGIYLTGCTDFTIDGIKAGGTKYWPIIVTTGSGNGIISNCYAYGSTAQSGIAVSGTCTNIQVSNNRSNDNYYSGIIVEPTSTNISIDNNILVGNKSSIYCVNTSYVSIQNNICDGTGSGTTAGIVLATTTDCVVQNNVVRAHLYGIQAILDNSNVTINGNTIRSSKENAIWVHKDTGTTLDNITITNNVLTTSCTVGAEATTSAIYVGSATGVRVLNNTIKGTNGKKLYNFTVSGNVVAFAPVPTDAADSAATASTITRAGMMLKATEYVAVTTAGATNITFKDAVTIYAIECVGTVSNTTGNVNFSIDGSAVGSVNSPAHTAEAAYASATLVTYIKKAADTTTALTVAHSVDNAYITTAKIKLLYF